MFTENEALKVHLATVHSKVKETHSKDVFKFECEECGKKFKWTSKLKRHLQVHLNEKCHECDTCKKTFAYKDDLKRHNVTVHRNEKCHQCDVCGKSFPENRSLLRHFRAVHPQTTSN
jgi:KRAB domain-containing zinc finger protein